MSGGYRWNLVPYRGVQTEFSPVNGGTDAI